MGRLVLSEHVAKTVRKAKMSFAGLPFLPELGILVKVNWFQFNRHAGNFSNRCITISLNGPTHESLEFVSGINPRFGYFGRSKISPRSHFNRSITRCNRPKVILCSHRSSRNIVDGGNPSFLENCAKVISPRRLRRNTANFLSSAEATQT